MAGDLQALLEKIEKDGVEKARREADAILADARAKAKASLDAAAAEAESLRTAARRDAEGFAERARESVRQAARDTVLRVEAAVGTMLENLLVKNVDAALSDPKIAADLAAAAVKALDTPAEVACRKELAEALKAQLASQKNITVVLDPQTGSGFSVRIDGGRVEHAFTGEIVAGELAARLRPDLAALLK